MGQIYKHRRRVDGASGSPDVLTSFLGEIAINFPGAAGTTGTPELWGFDGVAFRLLNPLTNSVSIDAVSSDSDVEVAFNSDGINVVPGEVLVYRHDGTTYLYTGPDGSPVTGATASDFTALGSADYLPLVGGTLMPDIGGSAGDSALTFDLNNSVADSATGYKVAIRLGGGSIEDGIIDAGEYT